MFATACGGGTQSNVTQDEMVLRGMEVSGETVIFDNLFDQDTVLWFWAPW